MMRVIFTVIATVLWYGCAHGAKLRLQMRRMLDTWGGGEGGGKCDPETVIEGVAGTVPKKLSCAQLGDQLKHFKAIKFVYQSVVPDVRGVCDMTPKLRAKTIRDIAASNPSAFSCGDVTIDERGLVPGPNPDPLKLYKLVKLIGNGGFGSVSLMEKAGQLFAVKDQPYQKQTAINECISGVFGSGRKEMMQAHEYIKCGQKLYSVTEPLSPCENVREVKSRFFKQFKAEGLVLRDRKEDNELCRKVVVDVIDSCTEELLGQFETEQIVQIGKYLIFLIDSLLVAMLTWMDHIIFFVLNRAVNIVQTTD